MNAVCRGCPGVLMGDCADCDAAKREGDDVPSDCESELGGDGEDD